MTEKKEDLRNFIVEIPWGNSSEEGTYASDFWATGQSEAVRLCAEEMAGSIDAGLSKASEEATDKWIPDQIHSVSSVEMKDEKFAQYFNDLFGFSPDMDRLKDLIQQNRQSICARPVEVARSRG